ncbi:unnamed protein product [Nezara viridula]|uniref:LYR motif-containing protein 2 n=1 Tax=Nezara viridula TaxID=85310 RepID=A0A9P0E405_NEZVI|nr:unnamed protein product [Nezara viridula]
MAFNGKSVMSLKEFFLRKQVLKLYKDILLCIREVPSLEDQKELREWVRRDFKANKYHQDQVFQSTQFFLNYNSLIVVNYVRA